MQQLIRSTIRAWIAGALLLATNTAYASSLSGNNFHEYRQKEDALVLMYVGGWLDRREFDIFIANTTENPDAKAPGSAALMKSRMCIPENVTFEQAKDVICKYLADNPANRAMQASYLVDMAMADAFPCK